MGLAATMREIWVNYMQFIVQCANDKDLKTDFLQNPRPHLAQVGMKIPESVEVVIDTQGPRAPAVYIKTEEEEVVVVEQEGALIVLKELPFEKPIKEIITSLDVKTREFQLKSAKADTRAIAVCVEVEEKLEECEVVMRLPFLDAEKDIFGEVRFGDGEELLMTCCT